MKQQKFRTDVTEIQRRHERTQKGGPTDKYWFNNQSREEINEGGKI